MQRMRFDPQSTWVVLETACRERGISIDSATLIRLGENALYHLPSANAVARIGRSIAASCKELAVARWLESEDFPATQLIDVEQPAIVDNNVPVTFWRYIKQSEERPTAKDLGETLLGLHNLPDPGRNLLPLPAFEPMPKVAGRLKKFGSSIPSEDRDFLHSTKERVEEEFRAVSFVLGYGPIHGDAHTGNLIRDDSGRILLIDFEDFSYGPREWDVSVAAIGYRAFKRMSESDYQQFVAEYGFDPIKWEGFPTVRAAKELNMTTWLLQLIGQSDEIDQEIGQRISDLRGGNQAARTWQPF